MNYISQSDREFIAEKYHLNDGSFLPYNRFACHGFLFDESTGLSNDEIAKEVSLLYEENKEQSHFLLKARAFALILDKMRIEVNPKDYFVCLGGYARIMNKPMVSKWYNECLNADEELNQRIADYCDSGTASIWLDTEHFVPNWEYILENGISGIIEKANEIRKENEKNAPLTSEQMSFFDSIEIEYQAIKRLLERLYRYASNQTFEKAGLIADSLHNLINGAPQNVFDALQLMYIYFICSEAVEQFQARSLGNGLDRSLHRFYQNDLESGKFSREDIKKFLAYFMLQFDAMGHPNGHPFYLGGTNSDGSTRVTDLSYDIIDVYESLDIYNPKIQIKLNNNTPREFINRVLKMIRAGHSSVVFCCQPGMVKSLMGTYGTTYEEALEADISGCNEMHVRSDEACMISALPNAAKAVLFVVNNGVDTTTGKKLGLETGDFSKFSSFDEIYDAFLKQLVFLIDNLIEITNRREKYVAEVNPSVLISGTSRRSMMAMKDAYGFGVKYPTSALLLCSFATAVDSLMAIKELVFDEKITTLLTLKDAINSNWVGYEDLQNHCLYAKHKFGRNDEIADSYASAIFKWFSVYTVGKRNSRGSVFKVGIPSTLDYISQGKRTGATPDGRNSGEELSKNTQPVNGMETQGATGYINSVLKLDPWLFSEAFVADVMLHPSAVEGEEGLDAMRGLIETYMKKDGVSIQFNIFSTKQLLDAQKHPEKYKNLQVRVTGWNALWNNMSRNEQEAYIKRARSFE